MDTIPGKSMRLSRRAHEEMVFPDDKYARLFRLSGVEAHPVTTHLALRKKCRSQKVSTFSPRVLCRARSAGLDRLSAAAFLGDGFD